MVSSTTSAESTLYTLLIRNETDLCRHHLLKGMYQPFRRCSAIDILSLALPAPICGRLEGVCCGRRKWGGVTLWGAAAAFVLKN